MLRADMWRRLYKPYYRRIYAEAKAAGLAVMIHSCGQITELLPDLIELGVEVVHPLQPEAMNVEYCRKEFGRDLTFWGGLGSQSTIPHGTADDNRREARQRLQQFAAGGYILAPSGAARPKRPWKTSPPLSKWRRRNSVSFASVSARRHQVNLFPRGGTAILRQRE